MKISINNTDQKKNSAEFDTDDCPDNLNFIYMKSGDFEFCFLVDELYETAKALKSNRDNNLKVNKLK